MKIIFLDIDGVLNNRNSMALSGVFGVHPKGDGYDAPGMYTVDPTCVRLLEQVVKYTEAKIVISSTWRGRTRDRSLNVKHAFDWAGAAWLWDEVIDVTPIHDDRFRGREIQEWLDNHSEVTHFVIVDDDSFDVIHKKNFVHTHFEYGLQFPQAERMIHILGGPEQIRQSDIKEKNK